MHTVSSEIGTGSGPRARKVAGGRVGMEFASAAFPGGGGASRIHEVNVSATVRNGR